MDLNYHQTLKWRNNRICDVIRYTVVECSSRFVATRDLDVGGRNIPVKLTQR